MPQEHRLTLVACDDAYHSFDWNDAEAHRFAFIDNGPLLRLAVLAALNEPTLDAERLILDRVATAEAFLEILASLPKEFSGDVLRIDERGGGFLSATGRGGDRVLYALQSNDIRFYLAMHDLVRYAELEKIA